MKSCKFDFASVHVWRHPGHQKVPVDVEIETFSTVHWMENVIEFIHVIVIHFIS